MNRTVKLLVLLACAFGAENNLIAVWGQESPATEGKVSTPALVNTDFGNAALPRNNTASDRVSGTITAPWQDDSSWANVSVKYRPMTEGVRSFQRVEISSFNSGYVQIMHPLPEMGGSRLYRIDATIRGTDHLPLCLAVRHRGAPYSFLWRRDLVVTPQWQDVTRYFEMPLSTQPIGLFIQTGDKGVLDIQRLELREVSRSEADSQTRLALGAQNPVNFLPESRFPLGLPNGWAFTDNQRGNPPGFRVWSDPAMAGPSGAPALQLRSSQPFRLSSRPFSLPLILSPHVASLWVRGEKPITVAIVARSSDLVKKEFQLAPGLQWQRLELPFKPLVNADNYSLRLEGPAGDVAIDGLQVSAGEKAPPYASQWPAEVALQDEAGKSVRWAVTGAPAGAVLKLRTENAAPVTSEVVLPLATTFSQVGTRPYSVAILAGNFAARTTAWVEDQAGNPLSARASLSAERSFFPFVIPWDDAAPTLVDVSRLNSSPAGAHGFIQARNGHLVESGTGKRIRFIGVVFTAFQALPTRSYAEKVAARLAKYGVNLVRLHYLDNTVIKDGSLWDISRPGRRQLDPAQLDRLDYFVAQLKKHGIYSNINLKVGRAYRPEDGLPPSVVKLGGFAKRADYFSRPLIQLQKEYARDLLTHVNPYTGNAYKSEPAVFCVEINNESSLGLDSVGMDLFQLPEPFREEFRQLWNGWLARKYATTAQLQTAWYGASQLGPELLKPTTPLTNWNREQGAAVTANLTDAQGVVSVDVKTTDGKFNSLQLAQSGLNLEEGQRYTVSFQAKGARPVRVYVGADQGDYHGAGLWQSVAVTNDWTAYNLSFTASKVVPGHSRLVLACGENVGAISFKDVSLCAGGAITVGLAATALEDKAIGFPRSPPLAQRRDWLHFIADTEIGYAREMRKYLKDELGVQSLVSDSQTSFGGLLGIYREAEMDFVDDHGYWDHPQQMGGSWYDQSVNNTSSIPVMSEGSALARLSRQRVAGKPFSVSEYNHPFPNE